LAIARRDFQVAEKTPVGFFDRSPTVANLKVIFLFCCKKLVFVYQNVALNF
jgi:hypothetical protein